MITFKNYNDATKSIDWSKLPDVLKRTHEQLIPDAQKGAYNDDADVKRVVDTYIAKLNDAVSKLKKETTHAKPKAEKKQQKSFSEFEGSLTDVIEQLLDVTRSDAQGIVDANKELIQKSFNKGLSAKQVAKLIDDKDQKPANKKTSSGLERMPEDIAIVKRYAGFHGKTKTKDQVMNLLKTLQKAILEKRISKSKSLYGEEIMNIQDSLISLVNDGGNNFKISIEASALDHYLDISNSYHPLPSIALLKRYVGLQERSGTGIYEKLQRLKKDITRAIETGKVDRSDKYYLQLNNALRNIDRSPRKLQFRTAELAGLQGIKELWSATKTIATKAGKSAKRVFDVTKAGTKAAYQAGRSEFKKGVAGSPVTVLLIDLGGDSDKTIVLPDGHFATSFFNGENYAVNFYREPIEAKIKAKTISDYTQDKRVEMDFFKTEQEAIAAMVENYIGKVLYKPHLVKSQLKKEVETINNFLFNKKGLGFIPTMVVAAIANGAAQALTHKALSGADYEVMSVEGAKNQKFAEIGLTGDYAKLIGRACSPTSIFIYGNGGSGKSGLSLKLADEMSKKGMRILYVAGEQFNTPTFVE
ncbi:MAG: hypothetical protein IT234_03120, partial [Bacteroidia bacterium]|nr:hypothetical protein [Bacteroidia bacterium]